MNNKGFTLIELIVTIALLAIISTISFVSISGVIEKNKDEKCESIRNTLKSAATYYVSDNRYKLTSNELTLELRDLQKYLTTATFKNPYNEEEEINPEVTITLSSSNEISKIEVLGLPNNCKKQENNN